METGISPSAVGFLLSVSCHQRSTLIFIYAMLFPEGQTGEEHPENLGALHRK
jgi:hypothetical protein